MWRYRRPLAFAPEQDRQLAQEYAGGESIIRLAAETGRSALTVKRAIVRAGGVIRDYVASAQLASSVAARAQPMFDSERGRELANEYAGGASLPELAAKNNCSSLTVRKAIVRAGGTIRTAIEVSRPRIMAMNETNRRFTDEKEEEIAEEYLAGQSTLRLGLKHGAHNTQIGKVIKRRGAKMRPKGDYRTCTLNEAAFDDAEHSPVASYFAGLLFADGCVHRRAGKGNTVTLSLTASDRSLVEAFREFMGSNHNISTRDSTDSNFPGQAYVSFTFNSAHVVNALARYGIVPKKSLICFVPDIMLANRDFWRGCVDGDGWIMTAGADTKMIADYPYIGLCGNRRVCEQFLGYVRTITDTGASVLPNNTCWKVQLGGKHAYRVIETMYAGCEVALPRKQARADRILSLFADRDNRLTRR